MQPEGTREPLERIVMQYSDLLLRLAMTRLDAEADAEDCVQEVFLKLLTRPVQFRDAEHEKAWLIRVTLNQASDLRRRSRTLPLDAAQEAACTPQQPLLSAVRSLPEKYSAIVHLHYYEGYTIAEIAAMLHLPPGTVGTRLSRGRAKLKAMLEEDEP